MEQLLNLEIFNLGQTTETKSLKNSQNTQST